MELFITLTKGMGEPTYGRTLAVSHHVLEFEACSARPASKVFRWTFAGYSGLVWFGRNVVLLWWGRGWS